MGVGPFVVCQNGNGMRLLEIENSQRCRGKRIRDSNTHKPYPPSLYVARGQILSASL
jgi:hypothetical protein